MPSVPLTLGLAVPDRTEGGRLPRRRGGDVPVVWGSGRPGPAGHGGVWISMPSVPPTLGLTLLDRREGAAVTPLAKMTLLGASLQCSSPLSPLIITAWS